MNGARCQDLLAQAGLRGATLARLPGDASSRTYHRAAARGGRTAVVLDQGAALPSPGAGEGEPFPFLRWQAFYRNLGLRVPAVLGVDREAGLVLLEDLGDELLQARALKASPLACRALYLEAADLATRLAEEGTRRFVADDAASDDPLVPRRLAWEMDFLLAHALGLSLEDVARGGGATAEARELLHRLCADVHGGDPSHPPAGLPLCHRDHHARNLLVVPREGGGEELAVIDFQDTRRGPRAYDAASLAFDPYAALPPELREAILERARPAAQPPDAWRAAVDLCGGQRLLKAAGTYAYLACRRRRREYLQWFGPALRGASLCLARWPPSRDLFRTLAALGIEGEAPPAARS